MIVLDASVLANAVGDDGPDGRTARATLREAAELSAPELVDVETMSALRRRWRAGTLTDRRFSAAVDDLRDLEIERYPTLPLVRRVYQLRASVSPYDAVYVALAEGLGCVLLTADVRLANANGPRCVIQVLEAGSS